MKTDSYLVIGGCGLLGGHIIDLLLKRGEEDVAAFDLVHSQLDPKVEVFVGDITAVESLRQALSSYRPTCIIHTASSLPGRPCDLQEKINVRGTDNVIREAIAHGVRKLVYTSTASVVFEGVDQLNVDETAPYPSHHIDDYNDTKSMAEKLVLDANGRNGLSTASLRPAGLFGPGDRVTVPAFMNSMLSSRSHVQLGDNSNLFDWTYIGNAAQAHLLTADCLSPSHPKYGRVAGQAFFISNGDPRPWWEFPRLLWKEAGHYIALILAFFIEYICLILGKKPTLTRLTVTYCCTARSCNISKARNALDYEPEISLEEGVKRSVAVRTSVQISRSMVASKPCRAEPGDEVELIRGRW
ncbi:hypothetical protein K503DRAFT_791846 [Rhizopogon vinicolor AM-OR11-026]|uniref:3-beta hydroxysteroid dehydrogenase/isomerase domain-containing protein n=1 Tax=Rhizopogon vinicolor AM-OR11-026 TaxID=1314800 RepID=A0A1B7N467_9AGAM|nr:hypothetical protein K503DRAFT_791846 [Rhizopogon vinicolor AM-OR11-026]